jgi:long-chain fatty acid transport protein
MKTKITQTMIVVGLTLLLAATASVTNGDNLIGVGPIYRAMGGVGIASPQDAISAVFSNPAAMCFGPYCPASQFDFAGTLFMPHVEARISRTNGEVTAESDEKVYAIPAIGFSIPMGDGSDWRFGLSAYGVTGLGVDYRGTAIDNPKGFDFSGKGQGPFAPLVAGEFTSLQIMKFAPARRAMKILTGTTSGSFLSAPRLSPSTIFL